MVRIEKDADNTGEKGKSEKGFSESLVDGLDQKLEKGGSRSRTLLGLAFEASVRGIRYWRMGRLPVLGARVLVFQVNGGKMWYTV